MSTLAELQELEFGARTADRKAADAKRLQERLAAIRNGEKPLMVAYKDMGSWEGEARSAIEGVINECGADLLRIVEMRQEAFARRMTVEARQKRAALHAMVDPEPAKDGAA
jgi:hypothetical protein